MIELKKFGQVCDFVRGPFGGSLKKSCFVKDGYAVYEQQHAIYDQFSEIRYFVDEDKFNEMKRFELKPNDLIMSCSGTMGKVAIVPENVKKGIINQALLKLTPKEFLNVQYLKYWMSSPDFEERIEENTVGAAIKNVASVKVLKQIDVPIPSLSEQKQIVAILDKAFAAIDQAQANIEKNIENVKELFQSKLNEIFSHPSTSSGQDDEGWEKKSLGEIIDITHGYAFKSKDFKTDFKGCNPIVLTPGNFDEDSTLYFTHKNTKRLIGEYQKEYLFDIGDLVVVMTDLSSKMKILGKPAIIDSDNILHNQRIGRVVFKKDGIETEFLYYYFQTEKYLSNIKESATGTMVKHTAPKRIVKNQIGYPKSIDMQKKMIETINNLKSETDAIESYYQQKLSNLEDLKKSLLQKAFSGDLTQKPVAV